MNRDTLPRRLTNLPADTDVVVKVGNGEVDIAEIVHLDETYAPHSSCTPATSGTC